MPTTQITADQIREALGAVYRYRIIRLRGRGELDSGCVAVECLDVSELFVIGCLLSKRLGEGALSLPRNVLWDKPSRCYVLYFPSIAWGE